MQGNAEEVERLLYAGARHDIGDKEGGTPLHKAAMRGLAKVAEVLIKHRADVNARKTVKGKTPLQRASRKGHIEVSKVLIEHGADLNPIDEKGRTPLHTASARGNKDFVQLLLDKDGYLYS